MHVSDWRKIKRAESTPVKMTSQTLEYLIFSDYIGYRPFLKKKIKEVPLGNMLIFMYNDFQELCCKILSEIKKS